MLEHQPGDHSTVVHRGHPRLILLVDLRGWFQHLLQKFLALESLDDLRQIRTEHGANFVQFMTLAATGDLKNLSPLFIVSASKVVRIGSQLSRVPHLHELTNRGTRRLGQRLAIGNHKQASLHDSPVSRIGANQPIFTRLFGSFEKHCVLITGLKNRRKANLGRIIRDIMSRDGSWITGQLHRLLAELIDMVGLHDSHVVWHAGVAVLKRQRDSSPRGHSQLSWFKLQPR